MKNILVATDGSALGQKAVKESAALAAKFGAKLHIVHVQTGRPLADEVQRFAQVEFAQRFEHYGSMLPADLRREFTDTDPVRAINLFNDQSMTMQQVVSEEILSEAKALAERAGVQDVKTHSEAGAAADAIVELANKVSADLIVMGRHGLGGIAQMMLGSVSRKVLHHARVNVLTVA